MTGLKTLAVVLAILIWNSAALAQDETAPGREEMTQAASVEEQGAERAADTYVSDPFGRYNLRHEWFTDDEGFEAWYEDAHLVWEEWYWEQLD